MYVQLYIETYERPHKFFVGETCKAAGMKLTLVFVLGRLDSRLWRACTIQKHAVEPNQTLWYTKKAAWKASSPCLNATPTFLTSLWELAYIYIYIHISIFVFLYSHLYLHLKPSTFLACLKAFCCHPGCPAGLLGFSSMSQGSLQSLLPAMHPGFGLCGPAGPRRGCPRSGAAHCIEAGLMGSCKSVTSE